MWSSGKFPGQSACLPRVRQGEQGRSRPGRCRNLTTTGKKVPGLAFLGPQDAPHSNSEGVSLKVWALLTAEGPGGSHELRETLEPRLPEWPNFTPL